MIAVVIDIGEQIEALIESELSWTTIIRSYYIPFVPWINGILWPLYALISVIFFTSRLAANSEILAIFNAGVSFNRLLLPFLLSSAFLATILLGANHYVIPKSNQSRLSFRNEYISKKRRVVRNHNIHIFLNPNLKIYINYYNKKDSSGRDFRLEQFDQGQLVSVLKAKEFKLQEVPNTWRLKNYQHLNLKEGSEDLQVGSQAYIDTTLDLEHADFVRYANENDRLTTKELLAYMAKEKERGLGNARSMAVALHRRSSEPASLLILTIIGVALSARKTRGGLGLNIALGLGLGSLYIIMTKFSDTISLSQSIPVLTGVWMPNLFFGLVALFLVITAQK